MSALSVRDSELSAIVERGTQALGISDATPMVVAVSGGPDSMALMWGASSRTAVTVAHLDHALRPDSAADAAFVAEAARSLGLACEQRRVDVAAEARRDGRSIEDAARQARYRFLEEVASADAVVATAHTADDAAETVLLNLLRGSGLAGARGIPARRGRIVRPLLGERRSTLRALLDAAGIAYRLDPSNDDPAHLRNRVRAELMPLMETLRPGAVDRVGEFARLAGDDDELLNALAGAELGRRRGPDGAIDWHDPPPPAMGRRILRLAIGDPAPAAERVDALLEAGSGERGGVTIELGGERSASVRQRQIRVERHP